MKKILIGLLSASLLFGVTSFAHAAPSKNLRLYLDADFSTLKQAAQAIELGINTALSEENHQLHGYHLSVVRKNHRGNSRRSAKHLKDFLKDPNALAVFGGLHSPPLLANKSFINQNQILTLVPWAAAGPITRSNSDENWIFRLSIDDSNAGKFIVTQALSQGFKRPYLLLENTGWGESNLNKMSQAIINKGIKRIGTQRFNWGINDSQARLILHDIVTAKPDVILFVGNAPEGVIFAKQLAALNSDIAMRSHWGITGGDFANQVSMAERSAIDLQFIQTKFSFLSNNKTAFSQQAFNRLTSLSNIKSPQQLSAPTGFIHAYDLTKLLISAIKNTTLSGDKTKDMLAIHRALENLSTAQQGLIKSYSRPFSSYSADNPNAHEALSIDDYRMGFYGADNAVRLINLSNE